MQGWRAAQSFCILGYLHLGFLVYVSRLEVLSRVPSRTKDITYLDDFLRITRGGDGSLVKEDAAGRSGRHVTAMSLCKDDQMLPKG